jgi:hypothetical protein
MCYPGRCLEGLSKTIIDVKQDILPPGRYLSSEPPEYEARVLLIRLRLLVEESREDELVRLRI